MRRSLVLVLAVVITAGCGGQTIPSADGCADVVGVETDLADDGTHTFRVTVRSADTGWEKYADEWQIRAPGGEVLGTRQLTHPHVDEQPFTRELSGVHIPAGVDSVMVAARDSVAGFCGENVQVTLP